MKLDKYDTFARLFPSILITLPAILFIVFGPTGYNGPVKLDNLPGLVV
jgi:hypothetical protein